MSSGDTIRPSGCPGSGQTGSAKIEKSAVDDWELLFEAYLDEEDAEVGRDTLRLFRILQSSQRLCDQHQLQHGELRIPRRTLRGLRIQLSGTIFTRPAVGLVARGTYAAVKDLLDSWSWRLTSPLRWGFDHHFRRGGNDAPHVGSSAAHGSFEKTR